jgi:hypothetical protein
MCLFFIGVPYPEEDHVPYGLNQLTCSRGEHQREGDRGVGVPVKRRRSCSQVSIRSSTGMFQRITPEKTDGIDKEEEFQLQEKIMFPSFKTVIH